MKDFFHVKAGKSALNSLSEIIAILILLHDSHTENLSFMEKGLGEVDIYLFLTCNDPTLLNFYIDLIQSQKVDRKFEVENVF